MFKPGKLYRIQRYNGFPFWTYRNSDFYQVNDNEIVLFVEFKAIIGDNPTIALFLYKNILLCYSTEVLGRWNECFLEIK